MSPAPVRHVRTAFLLLILLYLLASCAQPVTVDRHGETYPLFRTMRSELEPFSPGEPGSTDIPVIRRYYGAATRSVVGASHDAGTFLFDDQQMALHLFRPAGISQGTLVIVHGYLSNGLDHAALIRFFLEAGYTVAVPELPGHGLSGGVRGGIDSFERYGDFLSRAVEQLVGVAPEPWHAVGHSTGALTILEYLDDGSDPFQGVVFAAPLVRNKFYNIARFGRFLTRPWLQGLRTDYDSPLGMRAMPLSWFDAQVTWNEHLPPPIERPVLVLQGTRDRVVAWRYNRRALTALISPVTYVTFRGATHVLFQEKAHIRERVLARTMEHIRSAEQLAAEATTGEGVP